MSRLSWIVPRIAPLVVLTGVAAAQESNSSPEEQDEDAPRTEIGECFTSSALVDMTVLNDSAIYVQTRSRYFVLIPAEQCPNLQRAYIRNDVQFVPFGRRICPGDGSYLLYETGGRDRICPIGGINEMESRAEARDFAQALERQINEDLITTRDIDPVDETR